MITGIKLVAVLGPNFRIARSSYASGMSAYVDDFDSLIDFVSVVLLCAPDRFPKYDPPMPQLDLDTAFRELRDGLARVEPEIRHDAYARLLDEVENARAAYRAGEAARGAELIQAFERSLISSRVRGGARKRRS